MSTISERYDRSAERYLMWWGPVLAPTAVRLLDAIAPAVDEAPQRLLDVGVGTGTLVLAALERWPSLHGTGLDGSAGMLRVADEEARRRLGPLGRARLELVEGVADRMPFRDGTFDLAVSSFVLQLVPDRGRALREIRRVLRPGGRFAFVTWLVGDEPFPPDEAFEDALDELDIGEPEEAEEARAGDIPSVAAAETQVRRAGFRDVQAQEGLLVHAYDPARYLDFLEEYAERGTFEALDPDLAARLRERTAVRLAELPPEAFTWRVPVVSVVARRPARD